MVWKIEKRGKVYYAHVKVPSRPRVRKSTGTLNKAKAEEIARKLEAQLIDDSLGKPTYLWQEAVVKWLKRTERKSLNTDKGRLKVLNPHLKGVRISEITSLMVWDIIDEISEEKGLSRSTENKYMALIRVILRSCVEWEWIDKAPAFKKRTEAKRRVRWLTEAQANTLISCLPEHQRNPVRFALQTGLRKSNLYNLTWQQVDMQRACAWIYGDQAKAGRDIKVPLNEGAIEILREQMGKDARLVFRDGKIGQYTWEAAVKRAGIENFRFHDLRHTWASWHVMNGTSLQELMELGGWHSFEMVLRYAHLSSDHLKEASENVPNLTQGNILFLKKRRNP